MIAADKRSRVSSRTLQLITGDSWYVLMNEWTKVKWTGGKEESRGRQGWRGQLGKSKKYPKNDEK